MLARAQAAIAAVTGSATAAAGLLDDPANDVVLSRQEWEIAQALTRRPGRGGGNAGLVVKRVEALERYAEQIREADEALAERHVASGTAESAALAEIDDLAENARRLKDAIRAAPHATAQAGASSAEPRQGSGAAPRHPLPGIALENSRAMSLTGRRQGRAHRALRRRGDRPCRGRCPAQQVGAIADR